MFKLRRLRWTGNVPHMQENCNATMLFGKPEGKKEATCES
jgi:hypothetical protein